MNINQIKLYDLFRKELHLPDDKAAAFVLAVGDVASIEVDTQKHQTATKDDIHLLKDSVHRLELKIYKAIFWTGIVQLIVLFGGVMAIFKFMKSA